MSVEKVAKEAGIPPSTYREWENGRAVSGQPYNRLAKVLGVSLQALFGQEELKRHEIFSELMKIEDAIREIQRRL